MALAIVGMPVDKIPLDVVRSILAGGASVCSAAGIPVAGGHSDRFAGTHLRLGRHRHGGSVREFCEQHDRAGDSIL